MDHWLTRAVHMHPDRPAVGTVTYAELDSAARAAAAALAHRGVHPGQRVALALAPSPAFAAALHGCLRLGAVAVPIDLRLAADERAARTAGAACIVEDDLTVERCASAGSERGLEPDAVATVMYTSGTARAPRAIPLTYTNWLANALGSAVALSLDPAERWLCPLPLAHVGGLSILIRSAVYATTVVLHQRFDSEAVVRALSDPDERITLVSLVPAMLARLLDAGLEDPPALRWALLGGGPIPSSLLERAERAGVPVAPTYGMTEACSQIATHGWPLPGVEVTCATDGEVLVRGANVAPSQLGSDGWLHTGDLGTLDDRGRLEIVGRKADTIITGGENVAPSEVESVLLAHPAVADAGVYGRPDPKWGEVVLATVVLRDGGRITDDELRRFCGERLARYKVPKAIAFATALPRTASGKLVRRELGRGLDEPPV